MKRKSVVFGAVVMSVLSVGVAQAALVTVNGYVCSATYTRQNNVSYGQGYVQVRVNTEPRCAGTSVGTYTYLGPNASLSGFQFSEAERLQLFEQATQSVNQGLRISLFLESNGGGIFHTTYSGG